MQIVAAFKCSPPVLITSPPIESCVPVQVGQSFVLQFIATTYCGGNVSIIEMPIQAFSGVIEGGVYPMNSTTYRKNIYWTPTAAQEGYHMMCAMAIDR